MPMDKQYQMMDVILYLYDKCKRLVAMNMPMSLIREDKIFEKLVSIKYDYNRPQSVNRLSQSIKSPAQNFLRQTNFHWMPGKLRMGILEIWPTTR